MQAKNQKFRFNVNLNKEARVFYPYPILIRTKKRRQVDLKELLHNVAHEHGRQRLFYAGRHEEPS